MKFKKMLSSILAACMLVAALPASLAADNTDPISRYAGQSVTCQVTTSGGASYVVEVPIPADATEQEAEELARNAVLFSANARAIRGINDISTMSDLEIFVKDYHETLVGNGTLPKTLNTLIIQFENLIPHGAAKTLDIRLENVTRGKNYHKTINLGTVYDYAYFVYSRDSSLMLKESDAIHVFASANENYATADSCRVYGYEEDLG